MDGIILENPNAADCLHAEWRLFQAVDAGHAPPAWLLWESALPAVVVGRHTRIDEHVRQDACRTRGVPVLRRCSGGGTVVVGPGCLNYAVGLPLASDPRYTDVPSSFDVILDGIASALQIPGLAVAGGTDLAMSGRKVSGNAQRRGRRALLHHGTLLYGFDSALATEYLKEPARQPAYRAQRPHEAFLGNLPIPRDALLTRLVGALRGAFA